MSVLNLAKSTTSFVVGLGTDQIVKKVIDNNVVATNTLGKVLLYAGRFGISTAVVAIVGREVEKQFDEVVDIFKKSTPKPEPTDTK
jgi:hypothetical protein